MCRKGWFTAHGVHFKYSQVVCEDKSNHGSASVGVSTDRNRSDNLKCIPKILRSDYVQQIL
jgi:hypothetical protein